MFLNARHVVFIGNPTFTSHVIDHTSVPASESLDDGIKILLERVSAGAMHNSGDRFDAPTCHPETRIALQDDALGWADEPPDGQLVTWMYGPAGAGKSAIAQTVSEKLHAKGQLAASFFFSRTGGSTGRGGETALIATLAYQLALSTPATKPYIAGAVRENPLIFDLSLDDQMRALIVHPLTAAYEHSASPQRPMVIVVDGLDECRKEDNAQSRVVSALITGLTDIPHRSHKLFITSRPEHNIVAIFKGYNPELLRKTELDDKWNPDDDIRAFLSASFADIRRSHFYFGRHPADKSWPSRTDSNLLVAKSSGQFIYASVVVKYIKSEDYYNPAARLEVILQLKNKEDRPYAELDALYEHIFSQIRGVLVDKVLTVLSLAHMHSECKFKAPLGLILSDFIGAPMEVIEFWLRPLVSLLILEETSIRFIHASLPDFLLDQSRSNTIYIYSTSIATRIIRRALDLLEDEDTLLEHHLMSDLLSILRYYAEKLSSQHKIHIYSMISDFNIIENVLSRMHVGFIMFTSHLAIASYLEWILTESESDNPLEHQKALAAPLSQIQAWMMERLAYKNFNGQDNTDQVDLWPFLTSSLSGWMEQGVDSEGPLRMLLFENIAEALEICGPTTFSYQAGRDQDVELSDQAVLFRWLAPHMPRWLASTNLLGRYAITGERYAVALKRISRYLLSLPKDRLVQVLEGEYDDLSASMKTFCICMEKLPQSVELYFFVLFVYSVIGDREPASNRQASTLATVPYAMARHAKSYLLLVRNKFPFLRDPASPEYIRAQTDAEEAWINTNANRYDPILSIRVEQLPDPDPDLDSNSDLD